MSEMSKVEEVARAIFDAMDIADGLDGTVARKYAVAAIEAMRKPTEAMVEAGFHEIKPDGLPADKGDAAACFAAMLDAALKE